MIDEHQAVRRSVMVLVALLAATGCQRFNAATVGPSGYQIAAAPTDGWRGVGSHWPATATGATDPWAAPPVGGSRPTPAAAPPSPRARAVAFARALVGKPYCWGGTGPWCYDCSGVTFASWWSAGRRLPRTSTVQRARLPAVPLAEARAGDVAWRPGHVGLVVGGGWVIHAPGRGRTVRYQALSRFVEVHRP